MVQVQGESSPLLPHLGIDRKKQVGEGPPMARCLGVCLPMQGTLVQSLAWGDSTRFGTAAPLRRNY